MSVALASLQRFKRVCLRAELWLWPWWLRLTRETDEHGINSAALHVGPLTLRVEWDFREQP